MPVSEINKDTFWALIEQAKEHKGDPNEWLMERLVDMGPDQARTFDTIARVYMDLAYQYGLWTAASVMERGGGLYSQIVRQVYGTGGTGADDQRM